MQIESAMANLDFNRLFKVSWAVFNANLNALVLASLLAGVISIVSLGLAAPAMIGGMYCLIGAAFRGEKPQVSVVFQGFSRFGAYWGATAVCLIPIIVLIVPIFVLAIATGEKSPLNENCFACFFYPFSMAFSLFFFLLQLFFSFSYILIANGATLKAALRLSWQRFKTAWLAYFIVHLLYQTVGNLGSMACLIGVLFTMPFAQCLHYEAYRQLFEPREIPEAIPVTTSI